MDIWSDTHRRTKAAILVGVILLLGAYNAYISMVVVFGYRDCLEDPVRWDGAKVVFPLWEVTRIDGPDRYAVSKVLKDVPVEGDTSPLHVGSTVSIEGHFRGSDHVVIEDVREIHVLRDWKERLGVLGTIVVILLAPLGFRWRQGRLTERTLGGQNG